jgi:hypothetical protein
MGMTNSTFASALLGAVASAINATGFTTKQYWDLAQKVFCSES